MFLAASLAFGYGLIVARLCFRFGLAPDWQQPMILIEDEPVFISIFAGDAGKYELLGMHYQHHSNLSTCAERAGNRKKHTTLHNSSIVRNNFRLAQYLAFMKQGKF